MNTLAIKLKNVAIELVSITDDALNVELSDGRSLAVPLTWFPRLFYATANERKQWRLIGNGQGVHWQMVEEDISLENLLFGQASGESQKSLQKWLNARQIQSEQASR
jgi:hypothetical protein